MAVALGVLFVADAQAKDKGVGRGHGRPTTAADSVKKAGKTVVDEAVDATADELLGTDQAGSPSGMPPGLSKQGKMPPGLEKKDKVPTGWSKGEKKGWNQTAAPSQRQDGLIRRTIKAIFRGKKASTPATPPSSE